MRHLAGLVVALLLAGCAAPVVSPALGDRVVYVVGRGWHTDVALPVDEIAGPLASLVEAFPGVRFLTFGFGERQFLISRTADFGGMLRALLPSRSAVLVTALGATPEQAFGAENVAALRVSRAGVDRIEAAIWRQFERSEDGAVVRLAEGPYPGSVFYAGSDTYDGLFTCNSWTAETLRTGGLPMPALGVLFSSQVMGPARWLRDEQAVRQGR